MGVCTIAHRIQKFLHFAFRSPRVTKSRFSSQSILEIGNKNLKIGRNMTKSELILRLAKRHPRLYASDVERIVNTIFDEITAALVRGDRVELRGFGAFFAKKRNARTGRNAMSHIGRELERTEEQLPTHQEIERRAHESYLERGCEQGHALEHWFAAEERVVGTSPSSGGTC